MRLVNTSTAQLEDFRGREVPKYAILSHRWQAPTQELSYDDFIVGRKRSAGGWTKIQDCCRMSLINDLQYCWIDTCCINKDSSAEESRSINSMYAWYRESTKAFVYLDDVHCDSVETEEEIIEFSKSLWFTRGWTLQELIAPSDCTFFNSRWEPLGDKLKLCAVLENVSSVPAGVLCGEVSPLSCSVAQRMFWAADRTTTELEDRAYCLIGLFDVNMPLIYGEGDKAFMRLQEEILRRSTDQTIFAWSDDSTAKSVLAPSPKCFKNKYGSNIAKVLDYFPDEPASDSFSLGNAGLSIDFVLIPWSMNTYLAPLRCYVSRHERSSDPNERICLILRRTKVDDRFVRISSEGQDLVVHRYLRVPKDPGRGYWDRSRLHRRVLIARSPQTKASDCFYGFRFNFGSPNMFAAGSIPDGKDVVCEHLLWDRSVACLHIQPGQYRMAGIFRTSGQRLGGSLILFGFDIEFNPFCLIASPPFGTIKQNLPLLNVARDIIQPVDLGSMSSWERSSWLDAMYVHKLIDEIVRVSREAEGDWNDNCVEHGLLLGERNTTEQAFSLRKSKLIVVFKLVESFPEDHWRITFRDSRRLVI